MRGKDPLLVPMLELGGITPAYAGKRLAAADSHGAERDHPRVCGEKPQSRKAPRRYQGSPPRMRGKASGLPSLRSTGGITPAYAGKSSCRFILCKIPRDHPRVCGEKGLFYAGGAGRTGSPPRMRGKAGCLVGNLPAAGITPAYAGKSRRRLVLALTSEDHPRVCGEKQKSF